MKKLNYDGLTESQQEQVESLIEDLEGRREKNSSIISYVASGRPIDHLSETRWWMGCNKDREDAN